MGFDFMDEGGGGGGVSDELIEDGIDLAPKVAVGALLKGWAFGGRVRTVALDDVARVDPKDTNELSRTHFGGG